MRGLSAEEGIGTVMRTWKQCRHPGRPSTFVRNDAEAIILRIEMEPRKVEWVIFNPSEASVEFAGWQTKKPYEYALQSAASK